PVDGGAHALPRRRAARRAAAGGAAGAQRVRGRGRAEAGPFGGGVRRGRGSVAAVPDVDLHPVGAAPQRRRGVAAPEGRGGQARAEGGLSRGEVPFGPMRVALLTLEDRGPFVIDDALVIEAMTRRGWQVEEIPWRREAPWRDYTCVVVRTTWDY